MIWGFIKRNRLSLGVAFAAWLLITVGIVFETWIVIVPLSLLAYWIAASQSTEEMIQRREAKEAARLRQRRR